MKVIFAYYGVSCARGTLRKFVQLRSTNWAARFCNGRISCSGRVSHSNSALTDPYGGCRKDFIVVAKCSNGKIIADLVQKEASGRKFKLNCC